MLEILKKGVMKQEKIEPHDIIITKYEEKIEYNKDGSKLVKRVPKKVNITKMVNERKKVIKQRTAQDVLDEIEKVFTK